MATALSQQDIYKVKNVVDYKNSTLYALSDADATKEWIQLQLKDIQAIERIKIDYGPDCCGEHTPKIEIRVGVNEVTADNYDKILKENYLCDKYENMKRKDEKSELEAIKIEKIRTEVEKVQTDNTRQKLKDQSHIKNSDKVVVVTCSTPLVGKYVTIQLTDKKIKKVDIAEMKIYGPIIGNYRI